MPSRYVIRDFVENAFYHVFNRGVEKRNIFLEHQDYNIFLYYLYIYLMPLKKILAKYPQFPIRLHAKNLNEQLELISYCLMPNHFHLLLLQRTADAISKFIKQLTNAYTFYFNNKYNRVGGLMQGRFKAVKIETEELLLHVNRYIHLNPIVSEITKDLNTYKWSSYSNYLGKAGSINCAKHHILTHFSSRKKYKEFIENQVEYEQKLELIKHITIED